jgi:hypothetical protein
MNLSQNEESKLSTECSYQSYASLSKNDASLNQFQKVGSNLNGVGLEKKNVLFLIKNLGNIH